MILAEAERRGWPVPAIFTDDGVSGSKAVARPALDDLERRGAAGEFDAVLVKSVDRLARSVLDFHRIAATAAKRGCALVVIEAGLDTSTPSGKMMLGILAELAAFEAPTIAARVTTANVGIRREGRTCGGPVPYGLRNVRNPDRPGMHREADPEEALVVLRMADMLLAGETLRGIADALNVDGIPTPRARDAEQAGREAAPLPWSYTAVRRVLSNPAIAGQERALGDVIRDEDGLGRVSPDSAILDADTFRRVLAALEERRARVASLRRTPHADRPLLDGIAVCAPCSGPLRRSMTRGYVSYTCANAAKGKCAARVTVAAPTLDAHVVLTFLDVLGTHPRTRLEQSEDGRVSARLVEIRAEVADTAAAFATAPASEIPSLAGRMSALREAEARLLADADAAPVYAVVPTKMTWAETWASTAPDDVTSRRSLLAEAMHSVTVSKPPIAGARVPIADRVEVVWDPSVRPPFPPTPLSSRPRDFIVPHDATSLAALAQVAPPFSPDSEGARFLLRVAAGVHNDLAAVGSTMHAAQIGMAADLAVPLDEEAAFVDLDLFTEGLGTEAALEAVGVRLGVALVAAAQAW